jgi:hypothetical protein
MSVMSDDPLDRLSLERVMAVARDVVQTEGTPLQAVGIIPSEGDTGYAEIVFAPLPESPGSPVSVGVSRRDSPERLRERLISELRDAS